MQGHVVSLFGSCSGCLLLWGCSTPAL